MSEQDRLEPVARIALPIQESAAADGVAQGNVRHILRPAGAFRQRGILRVVPEADGIVQPLAQPLQIHLLYAERQ